MSLSPAARTSASVSVRRACVRPAAVVREGDKIRKNNLAFSRILSEINDVITRMSETTSTAYVRVVNQNLGSLTTTSRPGDTIEQKQALERLEGLKDAAVKVVSQISGGRFAQEDNTTQAFMMIRAARAVWVYKGDVFYAWAGGIALDLVPMILVILLTLAKPIKDQEEEDAARGARQPVPVARQAGGCQGAFPGSVARAFMPSSASSFNFGHAHASLR
jgi:hypothetical protein